LENGTRREREGVEEQQNSSKKKEQQNEEHQLENEEQQHKFLISKFSKMKIKK
jgi:hypothetical protein